MHFHSMLFKNTYNLNFKLNKNFYLETRGLMDVKIQKDGALLDVVNLEILVSGRSYQCKRFLPHNYLACSENIRSM